MKSVPARFPCGELPLEGEWLIPDGEGPFPAVVVCHPHPPSGGNMNNGVVTAVWQGLAGRSLAAFRFNFRGVGASQGSFADGLGEQEDVRAALDFALASPAIDTGRTGLAGYSFGAMMAFRVALRDERVKALAMVAAPLSDTNWEQLKQYTRPKLYLIGDRDQMMPLERFKQHTTAAADPNPYQLIPGADHYLAGRENEVAGRISAFFTSGLSAHSQD